MSQSIKKQLVFSQELLTQGEQRAKKLGISFGEYLRYLVVKDVDTVSDYVNDDVEELS